MIFRYKFWFKILIWLVDFWGWSLNFFIFCLHRTFLSLTLNFFFLLLRWILFFLILLLDDWIMFLTTLVFIIRKIISMHSIVNQCLVFFFRLLNLYWSFNFWMRCKRGFIHLFWLFELLRFLIDEIVILIFISLWMRIIFGINLLKVQPRKFLKLVFKFFLSQSFWIWLI